MPIYGDNQLPAGAIPLNDGLRRVTNIFLKEPERIFHALDGFREVILERLNHLTLVGMTRGMGAELARRSLEAKFFLALELHSETCDATRDPWRRVVLQ